LALQSVQRAESISGVVLLAVGFSFAALWRVRCGFTSALWSIRRLRCQALLAVACLPILTLLALNRLFLYPFYAEKQGIFMFPCLRVLQLWGGTRIAELLTGGGRRRAAIETGSIVVCVAFTIAALGLDYLTPFGVNSEDPASAVRFLEHTVNPGDLVYVHPSAEEQIKLYLRLFDVHGMKVVFGIRVGPAAPAIISARPDRSTTLM